MCLIIRHVSFTSLVLGRLHELTVEVWVFECTGLLVRTDSPLACPANRASLDRPVVW